MSKHSLWSKDEELEFQDKFGVSIWRVSAGRWIEREKLRAEIKRRELTDEEDEFIMNMNCTPRFTNMNEDLRGVKKARQKFQIATFPGSIVEVVEATGYINYPLAINKGSLNITHLPTGYILGYRAKFENYTETKKFVDTAVEQIPNLEKVYVVDSDAQEKYKRLYYDW